MPAEPPSASDPTPENRVSKAEMWGGRVLSGVPLAFLAIDALGKIARVREVVEGSAKVGFAPQVILPLGITMAVCWVLSVIPRTAVLGTILWTGYLGGAVCTHVRLGDPLFTHVLFPVYFGVALWAGLWLRDPRVRAVLRAR